MERLISCVCLPQRCERCGSRFFTIRWLPVKPRASGTTPGGWAPRRGGWRRALTGDYRRLTATRRPPETGM